MLLLYSGGLDSHIISYLLKPDKLLYVDIGLPEQKNEIMNLGNLKRVAPVIFERRLFLADQKLKCEIVPMRNLFFAMVGAFYDYEVVLGATAGDTTKDKDKNFVDLSNRLLNYVFSDFYKNPKHLQNREFKLKIPFKDYSKTELVKMFLDKGNPVEELFNARSCYATTKKQCGKCRSCVRKYVALELNGIDTTVANIFEHNPTIEDLKHSLDYARMRGRKKEANEIADLLLIKTKEREIL